MAEQISDEEKQRIVAQGWEIVRKARANAKGIPAAEIRKTVDRAVREVRAGAAKRNG